jgi:Uma2 family endonuclease
MRYSTEVAIMATVNSPAQTRLITGEELLAMEGIGPCELIDGRIVPMSPAGDEHGFVEFNLGAQLHQFVRKHRIGRLLGGETGIYIRRDPDRVRAADILVISKARLPQLTGKFLEVTPELIVEVMSPNDTWEAVRQKLADYFSIGVEQVWVVEPKNRKVLIYRSSTDVEEFGEGDTLAGTGIVEGFRLDVAAIFET